MADSSTGTATLPDRFLQRPNTYVLGRAFKLHFFGEPSPSNQFTELANLAVPCTQAWNSGSEDAARAARAKLFESDLIDRLLTSTHQAKHHDDHLHLVGQISQTHQERRYVSSRGLAAALAAVAPRLGKNEDVKWPW
eukprot:CAMPEP_0182581460 /NCGR_PEP_ID=MMETSP1324-20130603/50058_1 /TAXON_ID=236786 /ORGANISM="Florenciella sp., Strain RCC1587" /LENGTH=136 /DNA_ID=CAMNT_0024797825 /DNA_START=107 /DNA_END=514 /DNA_ORIENTATION=+